MKVNIYGIPAAGVKAIYRTTLNVKNAEKKAGIPTRLTIRMQKKGLSENGTEGQVIPMVNKEPSKGREYMEQVPLLDEQIFALLEDKAHYEAMREKMTPSYGSERVSGGDRPDRMNETTNKLMEIENKLSEKVDALVREKEEIRDLIGQIKNSDYYGVLSRIYFQGKTLDASAYEMGYSTKQAGRKHKAALRIVERLLEEKDVPKCP